jgi:hypothetical protein
MFPIDTRPGKTRWGTLLAAKLVSLLAAFSPCKSEQPSLSKLRGPDYAPCDFARQIAASNDLPCLGTAWRLTLGLNASLRRHPG